MQSSPGNGKDTLEPYRQLWKEARPELHPLHLLQDVVLVATIKEPSAVQDALRASGRLTRRYQEVLSVTRAMNVRLADAASVAAEETREGVYLTESIKGMKKVSNRCCGL